MDFAPPVLWAQAALQAETGSNAALYTFLLYTLGVLGLAWASNRLLKSKSFLSEYFLGSRGLGMWAFALTFAATSSSGGSFTGFPAKIYTHGWILALWIASYMVVPICAMGLLAKRINQVARISGSITVPDVVRDRFHSASFGLLATLLIVFFMSFNLVAQFKAGSLILETLLQDVKVFGSTASSFGAMLPDWGFLENVDPRYLLCLFVFGIAVIVYTTYGGFHAVVWTDVMQGIVMVIGVLIMLPLALSQVGGLETATRKLAAMTPPRFGTVVVSIPAPLEQTVPIPEGTWLTVSREDYLAWLPSWLPAERARLQDRNRQGSLSDAKLAVLLGELDERQQRVEAGAEFRLFRVVSSRAISPGETNVLRTSATGEDEIFPVDVVEPTTETELNEVLTRLTEQTGVDVTADPLRLNGKFQVSQPSTLDYAYGSNRPGMYVSGPGPSFGAMDGFLPLSLAISFFFMWAISGAGQPGSIVRLMAFNNSTTLRRSIFTVAVYYSAIYLPLVLIFVCARVMLPGMDQEPDAIMPEMAVVLTKNIGMGWLAGLLVAAPFAAVMSTVDSFLLLISSALVRDVYQRNINPEVSERTVKLMSYGFTLAVGLGAMFGAINPPRFLQDIIVYTGSGLAACFLAPMAYALYWRRSNAIGCMAGMLIGFLAHLTMYVVGWKLHGSFTPYRLFNMDPIVVGLGVSFLAVPIVSLLTPPPPPELVRKYFYLQSPPTKAG